MQVSFGKSGIVMRRKDILVIATESLGGLCVEVYVERALLCIVEGSDIVKSCDMISVGMGDEYCVDM